MYYLHIYLQISLISMLSCQKKYYSIKYARYIAPLRQFYSVFHAILEFTAPLPFVQELNSSLLYNVPRTLSSPPAMETLNQDLAAINS